MRGCGSYCREAMGLLREDDVERLDVAKFLEGREAIQEVLEPTGALRGVSRPYRFLYTVIMEWSCCCPSLVERWRIEILISLQVRVPDNCTVHYPFHCLLHPTTIHAKRNSLSDPAAHDFLVYRLSGLSPKGAERFTKCGRPNSRVWRIHRPPNSLLSSVLSARITALSSRVLHMPRRPLH